jgi:undecaprenyl pyrophosphate synthase
MPDLCIKKGRKGKLKNFLIKDSARNEISKKDKFLLPFIRKILWKNQLGSKITQ